MVKYILIFEGLIIIMQVIFLALPPTYIHYDNIVLSKVMAEIWELRV